MLLRMEDGRLVGAKTKVVHGFDKAIEAEALGLKAAIELVDFFRDCRNTIEIDAAIDSAEQFRKRRIIIEMDNKVVIEAVQSGKYPRTYWGKIARNGGDYIRRDTQTTIQWVRRNGNKAAHEIARWARIEPNKTWVENFASLPPPFVNHIQKDMMPLSDYHL
jgi:ribonuclease HI